MNKTTFIVVILLILISLTVAVFMNRSKGVEVIQEPIQSDNSVVQKPDITISVKHQYKDGVHTYAGTFNTPTPCYTYNTIIEESEEGKILAINYEEDGSEMCAEVIDEKTFKISFEGEEEEIMIAKINGELVNLNVFELSEDDDIDTFVLPIKG